MNNNLFITLIVTYTYETCTRINKLHYGHNNTFICYLREYGVLIPTICDFFEVKIFSFELKGIPFSTYSRGCYIWR